MVQIVPIDAVINGDLYGIFFVIDNFISSIKFKKTLGKYSNFKEKFRITYYPLDIFLAVGIYIRLWLF